MKTQDGFYQTSYQAEFKNMGELRGIVNTNSLLASPAKHIFHK